MPRVEPFSILDVCQVVTIYANDKWYLRALKPVPPHFEGQIYGQQLFIDNTSHQYFLAYWWEWPFYLHWTVSNEISALAAVYVLPHIYSSLSFFGGKERVSDLHWLWVGCRWVSLRSLNLQHWMELGNETSLGIVVLFSPSLTDLIIHTNSHFLKVIQIALLIPCDLLTLYLFQSKFTNICRRARLSLPISSAEIYKDMECSETDLHPCFIHRKEALCCLLLERMIKYT